ncbi:kelch-like protein 17 isoform X2 [Homarus americanus]|uniref:kelch-like protein 17 isoform X2 n=1 Tax=Homarus americanus TaxID=6706 RepID=UPI001C484523|nr:kelch-like protein 17 isoform X2 [Homarus americanus]
MSVEVGTPGTPAGTPTQPLTHHFHCTPDHASTALQAMNKLRMNTQLCDIELVAGAVSVFAHRVVLAAASAYFHVMFNSDLVEKSQEKVALQDLDSTALELLVEYSYTGEIIITEDNVQVLLPASSLLQMVSVREACCKFLMRQLHPSNCLGIRSFADAHSCGELHTRSHRFALQNFPEVCGTEEFLLLPFKQVEELIASAQLNVPCEEKVFTAVISWVKHDLPEREKLVPELLKHVRLPLLSRDFLTSNVDAEPLVRENSSCHHLLLEALKYHLLPEQRATLTSPRTQERQPEGVKPYLFACGGGSLFAIHSEVECYNPRTDRWMPVASMNYRRSRAGVTSLGRYLYVMGGYDGACDLSSAEMYNPALNKWLNITSMGTKRSCLGIGTTNGLIYCVGGYDGASCLSSVERYDPLTGCWTSCPAMATRRRYCRVALLDNCIYALGGFDSTNYQCTVERLDPRVGKWMSVPPMMSRRSSCGAAILGGMLYCIGGNDGTMCMSSAERFNPRRNTWEPITAMHSRRSTHEVVEIDGFLYALGGNDGSSSLNSMERYDSKLNKWVLVTSMLSRRSSVGAAVLECHMPENDLASTVTLSFYPSSYPRKCCT